MLERIFYELSKEKNDRSCYEVMKINPQIHKFGRLGKEVRGSEIKVKSDYNKGCYGFEEFRKLFSGILVEEDIKRVLGLTPGRVMYVSLPRLCSR
jgi:hypothetical protein